MQDLYHNLTIESALDTTAISADTTTGGNVIDRQGYESIVFAVQSGTLTDGTYTPLIEEGDAANLSDAAAVADSALHGTEAAAAFDSATDDDAVKTIGYHGNKRYVRLSIVSASTTSGGTLSAVAVKGGAHKAPVV